jgi:uncharacterized membrane protein
VAHAHHDHGHGHEPTDTLTTERTRALLGGIVIALAVAALIGAFVLRPQGERPVLGDELGFSGQLVHANVTKVANQPCANTTEDEGIRCNRFTIDITSGPTKGRVGAFEIAETDVGTKIHRGDKLVVQYLPENPVELRYFFQDFQRGPPLLALAIIFSVAVIVLGRWQGVRALLALAVTGVILIGFAFPSIIDGHDPTAVALVVAVLIALVALYLTHGVTEMITVALLGTFAALGLTAILAVVFTRLAHFTGFGNEDAYYLQFASAQINVKGLILAGIIVGSLGVLDDVTVTQASAVWQLHQANPSYTARHLYQSAVTIGRDHIASTVNTLVLAYAGASLPLLLLFAQAGRSLTDVVTGELVAVEVVRTLVGSIGLVAAVPVTTALAAMVVTRGSALRAEAAAAPAPRRPRRTLTAAEPEPAPPPMPRASWDQFRPEDPTDF